MQIPIENLNPFDEREEYLNVVVETPEGSRVKFSYNEDMGVFTLSKALPEGMVFPFNFGFIPHTLAEDGDPLDVLILNEQPLFAGCLLKVRPVAIVKASQVEEGHFIRNDRIIGEAIGKEVLPEAKSMKLRKQTLSQISFFFTSYNRVYGKKFRVLGTGGPRKTRSIVRQGIKLYKTRNGLL